MTKQGYWFILQGEKSFEDKLLETGINTCSYCMIKVSKRSRTPLANALRNQAREQMRFNNEKIYER
jgi:hypothetical protein